MTPTQLMNTLAAWKPVAYVVARGFVYAVTFVLGALAVWYGSDPQPDWLRRAVAVAAFAAGPLALVNLSRPEKSER